MNEIIILFAIIAAFYMGLFVGWLHRKLLRKIYKLSNALLEHCRETNESLQEAYEDISKKYHDLVMEQVDDVFQELEKVANEWEPEKDKNGEPKMLGNKVRNTQPKGDRNV